MRSSQDLLGTTLEHVRSSHPFTEAQIDRDVRFRQLDSATMLHDLAALPGVRLCLQFGLVAAIYVADGTILSGLDAVDLVATLGEPEAEWPARSGAGHTQRVYPEFGLALAGDRSTVAVLELFPPMSLAEYWPLSSRTRRLSRSAEWQDGGLSNQRQSTDVFGAISNHGWRRGRSAHN